MSPLVGDRQVRRQLPADADIPEDEQCPEWTNPHPVGRPDHLHPAARMLQRGWDEERRDRIGFDLSGRQGS